MWRTRSVGGHVGLTDLDARRRFHVVFDRFDLHAGKDLTEFMDRATASDKIVAVVTPEYVRKAAERRGGVGYETSILSADMLSDQLSARIIPVLRAGDEVPSFLKSKLRLDFRNDDTFAAALLELTDALTGRTPAKRPAKGKAPKQPDGGQLPIISAPSIVSESGPAVVATIPGKPPTQEYYGPIELENVGSRDAFNVQVADVSNRSRLAMFSRVARLAPGQKIAIAPIIREAESTRSGFPDLYAFMWAGQLGRAWDLIGKEVSKDEVKRAVTESFAAPVRISYDDVLNRTWITHGELIFGSDVSGIIRLTLEFRRIELVVE